MGIEWKIYEEHFLYFFLMYTQIIHKQITAKVHTSLQQQCMQETTTHYIICTGTQRHA